MPTKNLARYILSFENYTAYMADGTNATTSLPEDNTTVDYGCYAYQSTHYSVHVGNKLGLYFCLIFVIIGLVGNSLSVFVFSSREMRAVSSNTYLLVLAVSDSLYLIIYFLFHILNDLRCFYFVDSALDFHNRSTIFCKLLQYMLDLFSDYSTCLILSFTIERFIAVYFPLKFKNLCTVKRARLACGIWLGIVAITIAPYHFVFMGRPYEYDVCAVLPDWAFHFSITYIIEISMYRIVPVILIAVFNVFIIVRVTKMSREKKKRRASTATNGTNKKPNRGDDKHMQLTIMLILVSSSYIVLYIPVLVHFVLWGCKITMNLTFDEEMMENLKIYGRMMYVMGFAINFFLYTISGRVFREQLEVLLSDTCFKKRSINGNYSTCQTYETNV